MTDSWKTEIERLEEEVRAAFLAQDIARMRQLLAEDFIVNSPLNRIHDRATVLDLLERGIIRHLTYDVNIELITRRAGVVVVMGHDVVRNSEDGPTISRRFTNVWAPVDGAWRIVARQATQVA
jgi:ketosteroid isomerase-like protein